MAVIECCLNSVDAATRRDLEALGTVHSRRCLEHCDRCRRVPCVVVDGTLLEESHVRDAGLRSAVEAAIKTDGRGDGYGGGAGDCDRDGGGGELCPRTSC